MVLSVVVVWRWSSGLAQGVVQLKSECAVVVGPAVVVKKNEKVVWAV